MIKSTYKFLFVVVLLCAYNITYSQTDITIHLDDTRQTIRGIGSMIPRQNWGQWPSTSELNAQMTRSMDLNPSMMRWGMDPEYSDGMEISGNDNADPNILDLSAFSLKPIHSGYLTQANDAGVEVILTVWSPPGWMKSLATNAWGDQTQWACDDFLNLCGGTLMPSMYDEYAEWISGVVLRVKQDTDLDFFAVSVQNEPEFATPYGSCVYTANELRDLSTIVHNKFQTEGIGTQIFHGEVLAPQNNVVNFFNAVINDVDANNAVPFLAVHDYLVDASSAGNTSAGDYALFGSVANNAGKELWMTETSGYTGVLHLSKQMQKAFYNGNVTAWTYYNMESSDRPYYVHALFTNYIHPGAVRLNTESTDGNLYTLAFQNDADDEFTVVVINDEAVDKAVRLDFQGGTVPNMNFDVYTTSSTLDAEANGSFDHTGNYIAVVPANSTSTFFSDNFAIQDAEAPTIPTNVGSSSKTETTIDLTWDESTDNIGVTSYEIYVDGVLDNTSTSNSYTVTGLSAGTTYVITVVATDDAGNSSNASDPLIIVTEQTATTATTDPTVTTTTDPTVTTTATTDPTQVTTTSSTDPTTTSTTDPTITSVSDQESDLEISPNPASDFIVIKSEDQGSISINNAIGESVITTSDRSIDVSSLPNGIYFVSVGSHNRRIIIQH